MIYDSTHQPLSYGHIISFSPPDDNHSFLFTDGFISSKTILKNFKSLDPSSKFLHSLFQIYPSFLNSGKKAALNLKDELKTKYNEWNEQKKRELIQDTIEKVSHEYKFNQETFEKLKDTPISFDTPVQFLHIASNKFLACNFEEEADYEKENFKLGLSEYPSENTFLKFLPVYTYQKRNEGVIYLHDTVYLVWSSQYLNKTPYIHISSDFSKNKPKNEVLSPQISFRKDMSILIEDKVKDLVEDEEEKAEVDSKIDENEEHLTKIARSIPGIIGKPGKIEAIQNEKSLGSDIKSSGKKTDKIVAFSQKNSPNAIKTFNPLKKDPNIKVLEPSFSIDITSTATKKEINVSLDSKSLWKINLIRSNITDKNILCYGDIVWLNYSEKNATLVASEVMEEEDNIGFSKKSAKYSVGFVTSMFSDQQYQNFLGDTNGMWMIEHEDYRKAGMVEWGTCLRLRHLISGRYLSVGETFVSDTDFEEKTLLEMVTAPTKGTLFEFTILPTTISKANPLYTKYVPKDAFMKLKNYTTKSWIRLNNEVGGPTSNDKNNEKKMTNINTGLTSTAGDEIAFKIFKANENEVWETNFLISCRPFLLSMLEYLEWFSEQNHVIFFYFLICFKKFSFFYLEI